MSLVVREMQSNAAQIKHRLFYPEKPIVDLGIDLKRKAAPVNKATQECVLVGSLDVFGPKLLSVDDLAFGPIVHPKVIIRSFRIEDIQQAVSKKFKISRLELLSIRRDHAIVRPRQLAMYLCKMLTTRSLPEIGRRFGGMHYSTVIHAVRTIEQRRQEDEVLNADIGALVSTITEAEYRFI